MGFGTRSFIGYIPRLVAKLGGTTNLRDIFVAIALLINRRKLIKGTAITEYEKAFARQIGVRYAYSFSSGRVALYGLLRALGIGDGDEVILQVPTHIVVANAIRYVGATPVYVDCQPDTFNINLEQAERRITDRTKVLLLQHTFGMPVDMSSALELARRKRLIIIEDCVHALGATYDGQQVGSFGRAAFFSTEETKTISSTMGGMAVTDDPELAKHMAEFQARCSWPSASLITRHILRLIIYHIFTQPYLHPYVRKIYEFSRKSHQAALAPSTTTNDEQRGLRPGVFEQRLSNAQAALALRQLNRLEENIAHRRAVSDVYQKKLQSHGINVPAPPAKSQPVFVRYPIWVEDWVTCIRAAAPHAQLGEWFTSVLEEAASPSYGEYKPGSCPVAEAAAGHLVNLPTHPRVKAQDIEAIVQALLLSQAVKANHTKHIGNNSSQQPDEKEVLV